MDIVELVMKIDEDLSNRLCAKYLNELMDVFFDHETRTPILHSANNNMECLNPLPCRPIRLDAIKKHFRNRKSNTWDMNDCYFILLKIKAKELFVKNGLLGEIFI